MRTKVSIDLDIVHELPLAFGPQGLANLAEERLLTTELMGQRDPKLSIRATLAGERPMTTQGTVILVETNGAEPETTTELRGSGVEVINIDWDEVERGDDPQYIRDILARINELGVRDVSPVTHVGMPAIRRQLQEALDEKVGPDLNPEGDPTRNGAFGV